ncbi:MAG: HAD hydrolase family protein [Desulfoprunum sp.]|jgi:3-deoxy-D-manno-octulosonate 8-phosphate phosphatase (KDO 8-P phosphatase)|uniref:KdsC family phosphatase n=1 Tax=Desulfoprunum sp. TaxID=2020866 RepID=UPI00052DE1AD|nr:3-deoxy-D-manno-octulosonate 8-phosphate phosphatase [Desulfobulbus sp. Tol-SR]
MTNPCSPANPGAYPSDCEITEGYRTRARERTQHSDSSCESLVVREKAKEIQILLLDVDGVMTDGTIHYSGDKDEGKSFNTQDGFGLRLLQEAGLDAGLITARRSGAVARRADELKLRYTYQGSSNKLATLNEILKTSGFKPYQIAYMGDDWLDLCLLSRVGLALAPANAVAAVKETAHYVTSRPGGAGAVREACEVILEAKGLLAGLLQRYMSR